MKRIKKFNEDIDSGVDGIEDIEKDIFDPNEKDEIVKSKKLNNLKSREDFMDKEEEEIKDVDLTDDSIDTIENFEENIFDLIDSEAEKIIPSVDVDEVIEDQTKDIDVEYERPKNQNEEFDKADDDYDNVFGDTTL